LLYAIFVVLGDYVSFPSGAGGDWHETFLHKNKTFHGIKYTQPFTNKKMVKKTDQHDFACTL